jgi:hypothetical protein
MSPFASFAGGRRLHGNAKLFVRIVGTRETVPIRDCFPEKFSCPTISVNKGWKNKFASLLTGGVSQLGIPVTR